MILVEIALQYLSGCVITGRAPPRDLGETSFYVVETAEGKKYIEKRRIRKVTRLR